MEKLSNIFQIKENDVISITGTGGKTTLMFSLAQALSKNGPVLVTTSTKIRAPDIGFDKLYKSFEDYKKPDSNEIIVLGDFISEKNKLKSVGYDNLKNIIKDFAYVLIEADGSRNLPLKFWHDYEPVIYDFSTKVIGVFSIKVYDKIPSSDFIYNYKNYEKYIGNDAIDYKTFNKLISYEKGLFKGFTKDKFAFINQVESKTEINQVRTIIKHDKSGIKIVYGSVKKEKFYEN